MRMQHDTCYEIEKNTQKCGRKRRKAQRKLAKKRPSGRVILKWILREI